MTKRGKSILLLATIGVLLISGCGAKEEVLPETLVQSEEATKTESSLELEANNEQETETALNEYSAKEEVPPETLVQSEEAPVQLLSEPAKLGNKNSTNSSCKRNKIYEYNSYI